MLRWIGSIFLLVAASLLGERQARLERRKLEALESVLIGLTVLEAEVSFLTSGLPEALIKASEATPLAASLFKGAAKRIVAGISAGEAWRQSCREWALATQLAQRPQKVVAGLSAAFGPWRAEDMVRHIRLTQTLLTQEQETVRPRLDSSCRLWRYLGISAGLSLVIILY